MMVILNIIRGEAVEKMECLTEEFGNLMRAYLKWHGVDSWLEIWE